MKVKYSLHFDGQVIESSDERELRRIARNTNCYWEIYKHIIPTIRNVGGNQKVTILDMREMLLMYEKGMQYRTIASEFRLNMNYVQRIIKQMRIEKFKKSTNI